MAFFDDDQRNEAQYDDACRWDRQRELAAEHFDPYSLLDCDGCDGDCATCRPETDEEIALRVEARRADREAENAALRARADRYWADVDAGREPEDANFIPF